MCNPLIDYWVIQSLPIMYMIVLITLVISAIANDNIPESRFKDIALYGFAIGVVFWVFVRIVNQ